MKLRPEDALCEGSVNECTLMERLPFATVCSLARIAIGLATGYQGLATAQELARWRLDDTCGEGFSDAVMELRHTCGDKARRVA